MTVQLKKSTAGTTPIRVVDRSSFAAQLKAAPAATAANASQSRL